MDTETIFVVDDDLAVRTALSRLVRSCEFKSETFASAQALLDRRPPVGAGVIILDVQMPGLTGLDLQGELKARKIITPIVFITGHGDIPMSVQAMKSGAVDFLTKPVKSKLLLEALERAVEKDRRLRAVNAAIEQIRQRQATLTPREFQVFNLVVKGWLNKQIAAELGAAEKTIKVHRSRVMEKMEVTSVAELVQAAITAGASVAEFHQSAPFKEST